MAYFPRLSIPVKLPQFLPNLEQKAASDSGTGIKTQSPTALH
jgi:hypothetical protein